MGDAAASTIRFYLSTDTVLSIDDIYVGADAVPALVAGAETPLRFKYFVLPAVAANVNASWYLIAVADADGVVAESDETNNAAWSLMNYATYTSTFY